MGVQTELYGDDIQEFPHIYRGVVEDNLDPLQSGRVRLRIIGIHSDNSSQVPTDTLPWAIPATSIGFDGGGLRNIGHFKVPDIGSHLFIFFESGDHNFPVYFAGAPAIEQIDDYQEKNGKLENKLYKYDKQYDFKGKYNETLPKFDTPNDDKIVPDKQVLDWPPQTRKNTFDTSDKITNMDPPGCTGEYPNKKPLTEPQPIFPNNFFQTDIRIAFDGKANHDAPGYDGIYQSKPSTTLTSEEKRQELDKWDERKWGHNDNDYNHQHNYGGGPDWKPEYPMCSTIRNAQGEIIDTDILKERRTYIHPSKYFIEYIQLDSSRMATDFLNEKSIKNIYERQRGVGNSPSSLSNPREIISNANNQEDASNKPEPLETDDKAWRGRENNTITYDNQTGSTRTKLLQRFEERKHNPGREKTVIEDFVYRYYMNKVNETYKVDRNVRIYAGNDNLEIEHGDINQRLHRGSHNMHLDEGNYNRTVNKGWYHLHIDQGHHFVELHGKNPFEDSGTHETKGNPVNCRNQHAITNVKNGATGEGCDAKFLPWNASSPPAFIEGENEGGGSGECTDANQFFLLHSGHQVFRLERGHQHFQLNYGHQKFWLLDGHQTFHLQKGDQRFQLDRGDIERWVQGDRYSYYAGRCIEISELHWQFVARNWFKIKAQNINLHGNVRIVGNLMVEGNVKCGVIDSPGGPLHVASAVVSVGHGACNMPTGSVFVPLFDDPTVITPNKCSSRSTPVKRS